MYHICLLKCSLYHTLYLSYFTTDPPLPFDVAFNIIEGGIVTEQILAHRFLIMLEMSPHVTSVYVDSSWKFDCQWQVFVSNMQLGLLHAILWTSC